MSVMSATEWTTLSTFSWIDAIKTPLYAKGKRIEETPFSVEESLEVSFQHSLYKLLQPSLYSWIKF